MVLARKKPVTVEATQWFKVGDHPEVISYWSSISEIIASCEIFCPHCDLGFNDHGAVKTLEGYSLVCPSDWIIKGIKGELYPCKDDIFKETYDILD